ncbi:Translocation protein S62 [Dimargaris cristalligena]|uniref:Translocation protein SEC62 n=1 Tax=Dimargaris cristalligena TaxID=215637 RepID=A0A4V1J4G9_9FUNG|nr:Translocation protein S62 [Dimargaris cristalligena]RKP35519.1 translocation protein Sec62-domain-containing protein [Dimargaris cristalligena]|eukprot:RKP35519.1 translocation protein Sec62-domain-containing protein [Dimargaris cristalligena]
MDKAPKDIRNVAKYLSDVSQSGLRAREGILNGRRVEYFKGKSAINALLKEQYKAKSRPTVADRDDAAEILKDLVRYQFVVRCDRSSEEDTRMLRLNPMQAFQEESYYAWLYEGSQWTIILGGIGLVAVVLAGVMFPLWPPILRDGAWYISVAGLGFLGFLFILSIVRLILYVLTVFTIPPGLWLFPNLFEDVGFIDSFIPLYAWDSPKKTADKGSVMLDGTKKSE